jgi:hypothetical protein
VKQVASLQAIDKLTARDVLQAASHSSQHMQQRLTFILQFVQSASALFIVGCQDDGLAWEWIWQEPSLMFHDFYDLVCIDEKWFSIDKVRRSSCPTATRRSTAESQEQALFFTKVMVVSGKDGGWDIVLRAQLPNSPDLKVLDLGNFNNIQSLQMTKHIDSLVSAVVQSFNELKRETLDDNFITSMAVMEQCLLSEGSSKFSLPHMKKMRRVTDGDPLTTLACIGNAVIAGSFARHLDILTECFRCPLVWVVILLVQ